jgi:hypothetical protein
MKMSIGAPSPRGDNDAISLYISAEQPCFDALAKVKTLPPPLPAVEAAATSYEQSLREILPLIKQVNGYYKQSDYKDDKCAKGKAMHGPLIAAFTKFSAEDRLPLARFTRPHVGSGAPWVLPVAAGDRAGRSVVSGHLYAARAVNRRGRGDEAALA